MNSKKYYIDFSALAVYEGTLSMQPSHNTTKEALRVALNEVLTNAEPEKILAFESLKKLEIIKEVEVK